MAWFQSRSRSKWFFNQRINFALRWVSRSMACAMMAVLAWSDLNLAAGRGGGNQPPRCGKWCYLPPQGPGK